MLPRARSHALAPASLVRALCALIAFSMACSRPVPNTVKSPQTALKPRLIVQITVDQLRADLLTRFAHRFSDDGLRRFTEQGLHYTQASYAHAPTETAVGHATLFTGALPADHGIVGNDWLEGGEKRSSVQDPRYRWLGRDNRPGAGTAPTALRVTTLGDELILASGGAARVFGVSVKDRAAILPAGHAGKAFWYDEASGDFVTSSYYYPELPGWVRAYGQGRPQDRYPVQWELLRPRQDYERIAQDDRPFEKPFTGPPTFPHSLVPAQPEQRYRALKHSPFGDELTLAFVEALLAHEPLGQDTIPDLLAVSFSSTDIVGHAYGPESLEAEDNLLRLDRVIARLFALLLARVPERELLVVLSADHGISETPEYLRGLKLPSGRHPEGQQLVQEVNAELNVMFGPGSEFALRFVNPTLWLDEAKLHARGLELAQVERALAAILLRREGIERAITRTELQRGVASAGPIEQRVQVSFDPERTGHVYLVPSPGWILATDPDELAAMHGTPHQYDRAVPIALWGAGMPRARVARPVDPRDIAPTLAAIAGVKAPSGSSGQLLVEALAR